MSRAAQLVTALLEAPSMDGQMVGKSAAHTRLRAAVLTVLGPGGTSGGAFSFNTPTGQQIRLTKNFVRLLQANAYFGGDVYAGLARAIILDRHAAEVATLASAIRRRATADPVTPPGA